MTTALELVLLLLATAVMVVVLFRYLNLPPILGYLLVGAAVGPHALNLLPAHSDASDFAEFGVVFLMFSIGLEFSLPKLYSMKRIVFGLGTAQVLLTALFVTAGLIVFGLSWRGAVAIGAVMAMSSTAVVSKLLVERMQLDSPHGREVMGVLLFQDLAVVPSLILIPALGGSAEQMWSELAIALLKAIVVLSVILFFGQRLMRNWFHVVAKRKSTELFMLNILLVTLGLAWVTELAGLSLALGAFVAGMLISETEYRFQVEEDIKPFRDVLMGLFFVTIGMLLNLGVVAHQAIWIVLTLGLLLVLKFAVAAGLSRLFGSSAGTALRTGLWLCAGGEFGFVLLAQTGRAGLVPVPVLQVVLAALVLSLVLAPLISQYADKMVLRLVPSEWLLRSMHLTQIASQSMFIDRHAIICGYGRNGQYLARFLEQEEITYIALDLDPERVKEAAAAGEAVVFGDAARRETLTAAGISRAAVVVVTYADTASALRVIDMVRGLHPDVPVVVRTVDERDYDTLSRAGAAEIVPESFESSIMLASHALVLIGVPVGRVLNRIREIRGKRYRLLRGIYRGADHLSEEGIADLHKARLHSITLPAGAWCIGRQIRDMQFEQIDVQVTVMRRRGIRAMEPDADTVLSAEDVIVLLGEPERLAAAEERLLKGS
jgi:CPA2 family monovalent cation:H+ antiporter-2